MAPGSKNMERGSAIGHILRSNTERDANATPHNNATKNLYLIPFFSACSRVLRPSVPHDFQSFEGAQRDHVLRVHLVVPFIVVPGFVPIALVVIDASQIEIREVV